MNRYLVAPEAEHDLQEIWRYLLEEAGLEVADRIQTELVSAFEGLADVPGKGHKRSDLTNRDVQRLPIHDGLPASGVCGGCRRSAR